MNALIAGAGGFIGGYLAKNLKKHYKKITCVDIKPLNKWYQLDKDFNNIQGDLRDPDVSKNTLKNIDHVYNLACDMGGMGFIENNKADCMLSVLINTNLLRNSVKNNVEKFFFSSSACIYPSYKQKDQSNPFLKESDTYPADPEDGYGWEKLFSERMCKNFSEDYGIAVRIARYHNVYGPNGSWNDGREKAPAALTRKVIEAKISNKKEIEIWGDGKQIRSFMYIDDCITGTNLLFNSNFNEPLNIGSSKFVTINELVDILEEIADIKLKRNYLVDAPKGVDSRSSDNTLIKSKLNWEPVFDIKKGMQNLYNWIYQQKLKK